MESKYPVIPMEELHSVNFFCPSQQIIPIFVI